MTTSLTTARSDYIHIIEDVINKVREEFINDGSGRGESLLNGIQEIWEMKMMQAGALRGPIEEPLAQNPTPTPGGPVTEDLNVPYEGTGRDEYETPTAHMLFPPTPLPAPLSATADNSSMYNTPTGSTTHYPTPASGNGNNAVIKGRPSPYFTDLFVPSSGKRKRKRGECAQYPNAGSIPQQDGASIDKFQGNCEEMLNEDDDDVESDEEVMPDNIIALFDKVTRTKNKWKCTFSRGYMHINDKEILFNKVTGDFQF